MHQSLIQKSAVRNQRPRPTRLDEVFLKWKLDPHLNLDLNLDSTRLDLGIGLNLARGQTTGVPWLPTA